MTTLAPGPTSSATPGPGGLPLALRLGPSAADPAGLGGKGASLARLVGAGLPVPPCGVLTTAAYRRAMEAPSLAEVVIELSNGSRTSDARIDELFLDAVLPDEVEQAARDLLEWLGPDVAVRSSATTEDLASASFAGQYRSFLGIADEEGLMRAIRLVWASLWHRAPRAYRLFHGFDGEPAMAVVLMAMVPARRAGVAFTLDPGGAPGKVRVELVDGLAEGLVSGARTPEYHLLDRTEPERPGAPEPCAQVARLALRCEELAGRPQDVEWAWDGSRVWIVQSRPITTTPRAELDDGFGSAVGRTTRYTTAGIGEMLPGVLPVLRWSSAAFLVEEGFRRTCDELHALPADLVDSEHFVVRVRGRAAMNLDALAGVAEALPGASPEEVEREYFGADIPDEPDDEPGPRGAPSDATRGGPGHARTRWRMLPGRRQISHDLLAITAHRRARREAGVVVRSTSAILDADLDPSALGDVDLLALRARILDLAGRAMSAELAVAAAAVAAYGRLESTLRRHLGSTGSVWAQLATRSVASATFPVQSAQLGRQVASACPRAVEEPDWPAARTLMVDSGHADLARAVEDLARRAGSRAVFAGPTWDEHMPAAWSLVRAGARRPIPPATDWEHLARMEAALASRPGWMRTRILTGQIVDVRLHMVRALHSEAVDLLRRREQAKGAVMALGGVVRRLETEAGRRLAARGLLPDPTDVEHLTAVELRTALLAGRAPAPDVIAARRRCVGRWQAEADLPLLFTGHPSPASAEVPSGPRLQGWGASPGRHTGRVRVLRHPDEARVAPGDVVVAQRTDAAWSPVFLKAGAIVVEQGGPLSHAAIVARELGLPAVVNVPGAVARLSAPDVAEVLVDGDVGLVIVTSGTSAPADAAPGDDGSSTPRSTERGGQEVTRA
jgi:phosphohistidine swiveling domain-containing protein